VLTGRQVALLAALGLAAGAVGFAGAAALGGDEPSTAPPSAIAAQAEEAPPEEALLTPPPPAAPPPAAPAPRPDPAPSATVPESEPEPAPEPEPSTTEAPAEEPEAPARPARTDTQPAPEPEAPEPAPAPLRPSAARLTAPEPPVGIRIPAAAAPAGWDAAKRTLAEALSRASAGSVESSDIRRQLDLWRASLGPDAAPVPEGRRATVARALRANAWWFATRESPRTRVLLRDPDGVILTYRAGQGFVVNPVATTGRWRDLNADVPAAQLAEALLEMAVPRRAGERRFLAWEYYDVAGDPTAIRPGVSAMAQARIALTFAHAEAETGDPRFSAAAVGALAALTVDVDGGGARTMVSTAPDQTPMMWYPERAYPGESPWKGAALNGFMVTLLNLRGTGALLRQSPGPGADGPAAAQLATDLADKGARTLQRHLPDHDTGAWSLYGLLTPGRPWRTYLADLNYHCYHVRLLQQLAVPYPDLGFGDVATRWQRYVDDAGLTCPPRPGDDD
jgi:D-glucuronyl C5-epimerase C-terminus